jgi:hypothetical protein
MWNQISTCRQKEKRTMKEKEKIAQQKYLQLQKIKRKFAYAKTRVEYKIKI